MQHATHYRLSHSSPLHQEEVQRRVTQHSKHGAHDSQSGDISPKGEDIEAERAQDRRTGDFDVETVFLVHEREVADFIDNQAFEAEVEDGKLFEGSVGMICETEQGIDGEKENVPIATTAAPWGSSRD